MTTTPGAGATGLPIPPTEEARWRTLYDKIRDAEYGRSFTYAELNVLAEVTDIRRERWIVDRTRTQLVRSDRRYLENLRGVGYRVVEAEEHLGAGNAYRKKSMRAAGRSTKVLAATDLSRIKDPAVRESILGLENRMSRLQQQLRHQDERLRTTERTAERLKTETAGHEDRLKAVEEKLRRMAGESPEEPPAT